MYYTMGKFEFWKFYVLCLESKYQHTVKPVLRGHLWDKEKVVFQDR